MLQEASGSDNLPNLPPRSKAIVLLSEVKRALDEMTDDAAEQTAEAKRAIVDIETAADTPAAQNKALHEVCGSLLDSFNGIPERLTKQAEALKKFVKVFESICQHIEKVKEENRSTIASYKKCTQALFEEIRVLNDKADEYLEPFQRIALGEAVCTLSSLAVQHVFGSQGTDFEHPLSLNQLDSMYKAGQLDPKQAQLSPKQARRWEQVMAFVGSQVSMEELLLVDSELRSACFGDAHGTDDEKNTELEDLLEYAARLYSKEKHPDLHLPLQKMLTILAQFSSKKTPCVPDCTFASKMNRSLLQKFFS